MNSCAPDLIIYEFCYGQCVLEVDGWLMYLAWCKEQNDPQFTDIFKVSELIEVEWRIYVSVIQPWHQAIIWTNAGILLIGTLGANFGEI